MIEPLKNHEYDDGSIGTPTQMEVIAKINELVADANSRVNEALAKGINVARKDEPAETMSLDEAIAHAEKVADSRCDDCGADHRQLAEWLKDYKRLTTEKMYTIDEIVKMIKEYFGCPLDLRNGCQKEVTECTDCLKEYVSGWLKGE